jgi:hypothetical protein
VSEYATESPVSLRRRRQRRRTLIVVGVVLLGLFFAFWYALSYYQADASREPVGGSVTTCRTPEPDELVPQQVTVNVYNATNREGLAAKTAKELEERGFGVAEVANDPTDNDTPKVAEFRYGPDGRASVRYLRTYLQEGTDLRRDKRDGTTIDLVLGSDFNGLTPAPTGSAAPLPICPSPSAEDDGENDDGS